MSRTMSITVEHSISYHTSQFDQEEDSCCCTKKSRKTPEKGFFDFHTRFDGSIYGASMTSYFFQVADSCHRRYIHFCCNLSDSCEWSHTDQISQLVVVYIGGPSSTVIIFKPLVTAANVLERSLIRTFNSDPGAKHFVRIVSSLRSVLALLRLEQDRRPKMTFLRAVWRSDKSRSSYCLNKITTMNGLIKKRFQLKYKINGV